MLIRFGTDVPVTPALIDAAKARRVLLRTATISEPEATRLYQHRFVLVRPVERLLVICRDLFGAIGLDHMLSPILMEVLGPMNLSMSACGTVGSGVTARTYLKIA